MLGQATLYLPSHSRFSGPCSWTYGIVHCFQSSFLSVTRDLVLPAAGSGPGKQHSACLAPLGADIPTPPASLVNGLASLSHHHSRSWPPQGAPAFSCSVLLSVLLGLHNCGSVKRLRCDLGVQPHLLGVPLPASASRHELREPLFFAAVSTLLDSLPCLCPL